MKPLKKRIFDKLEELDWSVSIYDVTSWEFEKYSPGGRGLHLYGHSREDRGCLERSSAIRNRL